MDPAHISLVVLVVVGIAIPVIGFWSMSKHLEKDQAIDAATFLALRDLRDWQGIEAVRELAKQELRDWTRRHSKSGVPR